MTADSSQGGWRLADPGQPTVYFQSESQGLRTRRASGIVLVGKPPGLMTQEKPMYQFEGSETGGRLSYAREGQPRCSSLTLTEMEEAHQH